MLDNNFLAGIGICVCIFMNCKLGGLSGSNAFSLNKTEI